MPASDERRRSDLDFIRVDEEAFLACPEESVDYAVMERTADAVVVPMDAGWAMSVPGLHYGISAHTAGQRLPRRCDQSQN